MDKATDRILWSVLILAIGVGIFVFGKPAFVNLTNQVLHRDDLKATMQAPSLTSLDTARISAVGNDVGVSKHAYIVASTKGISSARLWSGDQRQFFFPNEIRQTPIPYDSYVKVIFKLKVDKPVRVIFNVSNHSATGNEWNGDDGDSLYKRVFLSDNNSIPSVDPTVGQVDLSAGKWHTIEVEYENTASANTQHVTLFDDSAIDFTNNNDNDVKVQVKDFVFAVDNIKYR